MSKTNKKRLGRARRKLHIRKVVRGTAGRPRLCVFRSARHIYAQLINDVDGRTIASASSLSAEFGGEEVEGKLTAARAVGRSVAEKAREAGVEQVCFDRNGYLYHGRVKALADAARESGLSF